LYFRVSFSEKYSNIKLHKDPSIESRCVPYGRAGGQTDRQTDMTNIIVAFRNFAKKPKILPYAFSGCMNFFICLRTNDFWLNWLAFI